MSRARSSWSSAAGPVDAVRRLIGTKRAAVLFLLAAGCRATDPDPEPERTIPVSVMVRAPEKTSAAQTPLDASLVAAELAQAFRAGRIFSEIREEGGPEGFSPVPADYLCEVEVLGSKLSADRSEATSRAVLSTVVWFFTVFPAWWIADRIYPASDVQVRARFVPAPEKDGAKTATVLNQALPLNNLELDLRQRGNGWQHALSLLLPPFWMEDDEVAGRGLHEEAVRAARVGLAEAVRRDWPGALLSTAPGAILILTPPGAAIGSQGGRADLSALLASRAPVLELRVFGEDGAVLRRFDRTELQRLLVPPERSGGASRPEWQAVRDRLGESTRRPQSLYRLDLKRLPVGATKRIRMEAWVDEQIPARFTVRVAG